MRLDGFIWWVFPPNSCQLFTTCMTLCPQAGTEFLLSASGPSLWSAVSTSPEPAVAAADAVEQLWLVVREGFLEEVLLGLLWRLPTPSGLGLAYLLQVPAWTPVHSGLAGLPAFQGRW